MATHLFGITTRLYHYVRTVGQWQLAGRGSSVPMDLAIGANGVIYVVDRGMEYRPDTVRVSMFTIDEEYIGQFSQIGEGDGEFVWPTCIALDSNQNVYVTDDWLNRISVFDKDGKFLDKWGVPGSGDGQVSKPAGIRFDKDDNLYLVDSANNRVQKFTKDGKYLAQWGEAGSGEGQFQLPWGLTIDDRGDVYVADWRNDRIQKFTPDGRFLAEFGSSGSGVGEFNRPTGVAVDRDGDFYVADWLNDRVQVFTPDGRHITSLTGDATISKWAQEKLDANPSMIIQRNSVRDLGPERRFWRPKAVAIDAEARVLVLDANRYRIQVYQKETHQ